MNVVDTMGIELLTLTCGPFNTQTTCIIVGLALHNLTG